MALQHCLWTAYTVERRRCGMTSSPLGSTHGQTTSGVTCHHRLWTSHTVGNVGRGMTSPPFDCTHDRQYRAWHDITAVGKHTSRQRRAWHDIISLGQHTRSDYVRRGMTSPPLDSTHSQTTSGVAFHHRLWAAQKVEPRSAWHANIPFGQHTRSNDIGRGMPSYPLDDKHD